MRAAISEAMRYACALGVVVLFAGCSSPAGMTDAGQGPIDASVHPMIDASPADARPADARAADAQVADVVSFDAVPPDAAPDIVTLRDLSVQMGPTAGGTAVTVLGTGMSAQTQITIGGQALVNPVVGTSMAISGSTPGAGGAAFADVVARNPGSAAATLTRGFIYGSWQAASTGMSGGTVNAIAIDPVTPANVYVCTDGAVFKSTDGGASWSVIDGGIPAGFFGNSYYAIAIDPVTPANVWLAMSAGVYKSGDGGASWTLSTSSFVPSGLAIDPASASTIYGWSLGGGVHKTTNGGGTWSAANTGLGSSLVYGLGFEPGASSTIYAATANGVYKTTNGGGAWAAANTNLGDLNVFSVAVLPTTPHTVLAATTSDMYASTDGAATWSDLGTAPDRFASLVVDVPLATVYGCATGGGTSGSAGGGTVYKSTNAGSTWTTASAGLPLPWCNALALDPGAPMRLYAGIRPDGLYKTGDGGTTWSKSDGGMTGQSVFALALQPANPQVLLAATANGVYRSADRAATWTRSTGMGTSARALSTLTLAFDPGTPVNAYVGTNGAGVYKSGDGGASFSAGGTLPGSCQCTFGLAATAGRIYAADFGDGVAYSIDGGVSWTASTTSFAGLYVHSVAVSAAQPATVYAGTSSGLWKSSDSGQTFAASGLSGEIDAIAVDPTDPRVVWAAGTGGTWRSIDAGATWASAGSAGAAYAIAVDPLLPSIAYYGLDVLSSRGVMRTITRGASAVPLNDGFPTGRRVRALMVDPATGTAIYAATQGRGVFKLSAP